MLGVVRGTYFVHWHLTSVGCQCIMCFKSPFWHFVPWCGTEILENLCTHLLRFF